jgi:predicted O-linked N-acetylglucosamine transferase (SPINDLY family)
MNDSVLQNAAALCRAGRFAEAAQLYSDVVRRDPLQFEAFHWLGVLHLQSGRAEEALQCFSHAIKAKPDYLDALGNRGSMLLRMGRAADALADFDRILTLRPDLPPAWKGRAGALVAINRPQDALGAIERALALEPKNPDTLYRRADLLIMLNRHAEAVAAYDAVIAVQPGFAQAWNMRGVALVEIRRQADALASFDKAVALESGNLDAWNNRANVNFELKRFEEAARDYERVLKAAPDLPYVEGFLIQCRLRVCDWSKLEKDRRKLTQALAQGRRIIDPQSNLAISRSPEDQLQCARILMADEKAGPPQWRGERYAHRRIRVAYVTADFRPHPVAFLIAGVFEHHDKNRFETIGVSFGAWGESEIRTRIRNAFDHFYDVRNASNAEVAALLRKSEVDIAVDLMGFTEGCRSAILKQRPAPVQVNFLGFPGTMGSEHMDYIVADRVLIPPDEQRFYAEKVVYLPDTYQANDSKRQVAERTPTRAEAGLPDRGFVFCCFNNNYKITPEMFEIWTRLLSAVEGSVLWLLEDSPVAARNLRAHAEARGVDPMRLIFAPRTSPAEHLARQRLADLFLDTSPYTAHTTCSDALWVGLPVVTFTGSTFAAHVASSLLKAAGVPELVAKSLEEYERLAVNLARDGGLLSEIKAKLARNRDTCALFDTGRFTRHLEAAFTRMAERTRSGLPPESFGVEPLP